MAKKNTASAETIISVKGFDAEFRCRGFQYEVGATYTHKGEVIACPDSEQAARGEGGFHACENPLDVLQYYPLLTDEAQPNRFAVVEQSGTIARHDEDTKIASASITITAELSLPEFVKRAVTWVIDHCGKDAKEGETAASGYGSQLAASGENSVIASSSYGGIVKGALGTWIALAEFGDNGKCVGFATGCIGKDGLQSDVYYRSHGGKLVKAQP